MSSSTDKNNSELRLRRNRIINESREEKLREKRFKEYMKQSTLNSTSQFFQVFMVLFTALVIIATFVLQYIQPQFLLRMVGRQSAPPFYFATKYPNNVVLERDLPRFYQTLSIATVHNEHARKALQKVIRSRTQLNRRIGNLKAIVKAWDISNIQALIRRGLCGDDFAQAFQHASDTRQNDLVMWCLVATRVVEGYFQETVEMIDSALMLTRNRGMVVQRQKNYDGNGGGDGHGNALSTSFYLHPRHNHTQIEYIPSKVLAMAISTTLLEEHEGNEIRTKQHHDDLLERYLYDLVMEQGNQDDYIVLDEVCQVGSERPDRAIAVECGDQNDHVVVLAAAEAAAGTTITNRNKYCCYFVVPEKYGGRFDLGDKNNEDDD